VHLFYQRRLRRSRAPSTNPFGTAVGIVTLASPFPEVHDAGRKRANGDVGQDRRRLDHWENQVLEVVRFNGVVGRRHRNRDGTD